jgi:Omp85 superfamily domain
VDNVFTDFPNLVHVAGHEHGLQLIKDKQLQVISGAGAKSTNAAKRKHSLFADATQGYVTVDLLRTNETRFTYYTYKDSGTQVAFTYKKAYQNVKKEEELSYKEITTDSIEVSAYAPYNDVGNLHRTLLGENYREEWAAPTMLPVFKISKMNGGLTPLKRGGGHQTLSLRLKDKDGKEWVLRSIRKYPDVILPEQLRESFAKDIVYDAMTAQSPYAPLIVPVLATAVNVRHANPVIGYVAPDKQLGIYQKTFANSVCLFEEREPGGNSDNTTKMLGELNKDNDNSVDSNSFFRARLLDLYLGDWDRHEDQWRWIDDKKGGGKKYTAVPRDRDQALYRGKGFFPTIAAQNGVAPFLRGFRPAFKLSNEFFINGKNLDNRFLNQLDHNQWMNATHDFTAALTDSVLETSLQKLPQAQYNIRHDELFDIMKKRRNNLAAASEKYFFFLNKIADIRVSDKNELIEISDAPDNGLLVVIHKISKERKIKEQLFSKTFLPSSTKEIRIFTGKGNDSVVINTKQNSIKLRIVGGDGDKEYNVVNAGKKIQVYEKESNASFEGMTDKLRKHLSNDSSNLAIVPTNRYNLTVPFFLVGLNPDDGLLMGVNIKHTHQGFRKIPFASVQQLSLLHSFSTNAFRIGYKAEWLGTGSKPDLLLLAVAKAPDNTQNFFGLGNETVFNKTGNYKRFYRTRFAIYQADPALRWRGDKGSSFSIGPSYQFYHYNADENNGRFITNTSLIGSYDSSTITRDKSHLGLVLNYTNDKRNNKILTAWGSYVNIRVQGYTGLNSYSKSFVQIIPEIALYKPLNAAQTIILAERIGGGISLGKTAFYQSLFLGGQENLLGYRQYRFAGLHSFYNNLELRIKIGDFANYILPGQFGFTSFFDIGRVWKQNDNSDKWHNGVGGGFYFAPAQLVVLQIVAGYSKEGWYPYFTMGFRF